MLNADIKKLNDQKQYWTLTLKVIHEMHPLGFELNEICKLPHIISEIALANDVNFMDAQKRFFIDIENDYNNIIGFKKSVNDLKAEKRKLEQEVPGYKDLIQFRATTISNLDSLYYMGVTNSDILGMTDLVRVFRDEGFLENSDVEKNSDSSKRSIYNTFRTGYWQSFIEYLQSLKNLQSKIRERKNKLDIISNQIIVKQREKQYADKKYIQSVANLNYLTEQLLYNIKMFNHYPILSNALMPSRFTPIVIILIVHGYRSDDDDDNQERLS